MHDHESKNFKIHNYVGMAFVILNVTIVIGVVFIIIMLGWTFVLFSCLE